MISFEPLKKQLKEKKLNLVKLGEISGISHEELYQVLLGRKIPRTSLIEKICLVLNCKIQDVMKWEEGEYNINNEKVEYITINWENLCNNINNKGVSLGKLSEQIGRGYGFLSNAKQRKSKIRQEELTAICKILNCSKEDLTS